MSIINVYRRWSFRGGSDYCESVLYNESQCELAGRIADISYPINPYAIKRNKHYLMTYDFQDRLRIYTSNKVNSQLTVVTVRGYGR